MKKIIIVFITVLLITTIFFVVKKYNCNQKNARAIENNVAGAGFGRFGDGDVICP